MDSLTVIKTFVKFTCGKMDYIQSNLVRLFWKLFLSFLRQIFFNLFTTTGETYLNSGKVKNSPVDLVSKYSAAS